MKSILYSLLFVIVSLTAYGQDVYEPNDLPNADIITEVIVGQNYSITLHTNDDVDWFKFTPSQSGVYKIKVLNVPLTPSNLDIDINVVQLDEFNNQLNVSTDNSTPPNVGAQIEVLACESDEPFLFRIKDGGSNASSSVVMELSIELDESDECECNNTFSTSCLRTTGSSFEAKMWGINELISDGEPYDRDEDMDFYRVMTPNSGVLEINITEVPSNLPLLIEVYDSQENLVNETQANSGEDASSITIVCDTMYFFRVSSQNPFSPYDYRLSDTPFSISIELDETDECECNNTFETACSLELGQLSQVKLWGVNQRVSDGTSYDRDEDQDFFQIELDSCGTLNLNVSDVFFDQSIKISLYDENQEVLIEEQGQPGEDVSISSEQASGVYFIQLTSRHPFSPYDYRLRDSLFTFEVFLESSAAYILQTDSSLTSSVEYLSAPLSYQWIDCETNQEIAGEDESIFIPTETGSYQLAVSNQTCQVLSSCEEFIITSLSEANEVSSFQLFPNPVNDILSLGVNKRFEAIVIYGIDGKEIIRERDLEGKTTDIDVSELSPGMYVVVGIDPSGRFAGRATLMKK